MPERNVRNNVQRQHRIQMENITLQRPVQRPQRNGQRLAKEQPQGVRLINFLTENHKEIIAQEQQNYTRINLYGIGNYWHAAEESACQLEKLFPKVEKMVMRFDDFPFPFVIAAITDTQLRTYTKLHLMKVDHPDFKVIVTKRMSAQSYYDWHKETTEDFLGEE